MTSGAVPKFSPHAGVCTAKSAPAKLEEENDVAETPGDPCKRCGAVAWDRVDSFRDGAPPRFLCRKCGQLRDVDPGDLVFYDPPNPSPVPHRRPVQAIVLHPTMILSTRDGSTGPLLHSENGTFVANPANVRALEEVWS